MVWRGRGTGRARGRERERQEKGEGEGEAGGGGGRGGGEEGNSAEHSTTADNQFIAVQHKLQANMIVRMNSHVEIVLT